MMLETRGGTLQLTFEFKAAADTTPPFLGLPPDVAAEATGPAGSVVTFSTSAWDRVDGDVPVACDPASGSTFALGATTVLCRATDAAGNTANGSFEVRVVDTTPPSVAYSDHPSTYEVSDTVAITCTATDLVSVVETTCADVIGPAWSFEPGPHQFTAMASDAAGNSASAVTTFIVNEVNYPALKTLTSRWVWKAQIASQLNAYLDAAYKADQKCNVKAKDSNLASYRSLLAAQTGKSVSEADARTLAALSTEL
jgi:hypothetical protein